MHSLFGPKRLASLSKVTRPSCRLICDGAGQTPSVLVRRQLPLDPGWFESQLHSSLVFLHVIRSRACFPSEICTARAVCTDMSVRVFGHVPGDAQFLTRWRTPSSLEPSKPLGMRKSQGDIIRTTLSLLLQIIQNRLCLLVSCELNPPSGGESWSQNQG